MIRLNSKRELDITRAKPSQDTIDKIRAAGKEVFVYSYAREIDKTYGLCKKAPLATQSLKLDAANAPKKSYSPRFYAAEEEQVAASAVAASQSTDTQEPVVQFTVG